MDVTCDNCKAEYDFDDTLLGDKGTTVKCSKCGHVFRVMPPRREPTRSALKVRFRDGRIESVASLRELQQRIQAGQVGVDDELGRDGFTYRRLGDVPELKNFFARNAPPSGPLPSANPAKNHDLPHRGEPIPAKPAPKRTMLGMGAGDIPSAPRVPNFGPATAALAPTQPGATTPKSTLQGRAPVSSAPTAPSMAIPPRDLPSRHAPISSAPTPTNQVPMPGKTAPTKQAAPSSYTASAPVPATSTAPSATAPTQIAQAFGQARAGSAEQRGPTYEPSTDATPTRVAAYADEVEARGSAREPNDSVPTRAVADVAAAFGTSPRSTSEATPMRPLAGVVEARGSAREQNSASPVAQRPAGPALRVSDSVMEGPMRADGPHSPRSPGLDSIAPGALKAASQPQSGAPRPTPGKGVQLSLEEDEVHERARSSGGSRWLLYVGAAALLGGGAFVAARQFRAEPAPATLSAAPSDKAAPGAAPAGDNAPVVPADAKAAALAPSAEEKQEAPTDTATPPAAGEAPAPEAPKASADKGSASKPAAPSASVETRPAREQVSDKTGESSTSTREPKDYAGWVGRGDQLLAKGDLPGAQKAFEAAVALRGSGSEGNSGLGAALLRQGQTREAIPFLTRAASNGFAEASVGLGDAYRKLGDKDAAIEAYETYLARLPRGARVSYVKLQLEGLGKETGSKPAPSPTREPESHVAPSTDYRPAGELEPAPAAPAAPESPQ